MFSEISFLHAISKEQRAAIILHPWDQIQIMCQHLGECLKLTVFSCERTPEKTHAGVKHRQNTQTAHTDNPKDWC